MPLRDIRESVRLIREFVGSMTIEEYKRDRKTQAAVERHLLVISEAAKRLGDDAERLAPGVAVAQHTRHRQLAPTCV